MRLSAAGARVARMHATDFKAPAPEGEKGIGKLRVWESNGLGRLRVSRAIGARPACMLIILISLCTQASHWGVWWI